MPRYMYEVAYTPEAWGTLMKKPQDRIEAVRPAIRKLGGRIEAAYFAFGDYDLVAIASMPDNVSAAAFSIAASGIGRWFHKGDQDHPAHDDPRRHAGHAGGQEIGLRSTKRVAFARYVGCRLTCRAGFCARAGALAPTHQHLSEERGWCYTCAGEGPVAQW